MPKTSFTTPALFLVAGLAPLLTLFAPLGMAPLFMLAGLAGLHDCWRNKLWGRIDRPLAVILGTAALFGALSTLWAMDKGQTLKTSLVLGSEFFAGLSLLAASKLITPARQRQIVLILAISLSGAITLALMEHLTFGLTAMLPGHQGSGNMAQSMSRGLTFIALLLTPLTVALWHRRQRAWSLMFWLAGAAAIVISHSLASKLVLPLSIILAILFWARPKLTAGLCAFACMAVMVAALPLALRIPDAQTAYDMARWLSPSAHHRLTIWRFSARNAVENPLLGWALDASRTIPGADDEVFYTLTTEGKQHKVPEAQLPLHPHSAPIQIWLELGLVGILLSVALFWRVFRHISTQTALMAVYSGTTVVSGFVIACVSYGIWQSWWQGTLWLSLSLITMFNAPTNAADGRESSPSTG